MNIQIDFYPEDKMAIFDLLEQKQMEANKPYVVMEGVSAEWKPSFTTKEFGSQELQTIILTLSGGVTSSVIGAWIYDKIKGRARKIRIERQEVELQEGQITKIIQEKIDIEE